MIPKMTPGPGERMQRYVGDLVEFRLGDQAGQSPQKGWRALLRTNLGRAAMVRREIIQAHARGLPPAGASWRDLPMTQDGSGWSLKLPLAEVGYFKAKAFLVDPKGWQHWPEGRDVGLSVHPDRYRTANTIYCAFPRMFGATRTLTASRDPKREQTFFPLDEAGYTVIPPSGKLRDLKNYLPHIFGTLGCRILHLLPVSPTPTTYARFGRYGSPYAAQDLTAIDPALVVFDQRTTGIDQFRDLAYETHTRGGRLLLDIVINHTGWGSVLQENHPEWFVRRSEHGPFVSPGAWGTTWEDLVELKHDNVALWDELSEMFLTWCRRGADGFRCDAGYKVPVAAWQYIIARVQEEFPEALFLLEGLGGAWEATEALLTEGGMQWAYSELFQNYSGREIASYVDFSTRQSERVGSLLHYSETHDNERLAVRGRAWSLLRNRLCALTSVSGGYGFTSGVEWLATEKINVHGSSGLAWDNPDNLVPELAALNQLLSSHPCFFDRAGVTLLSPVDSPVCAVRREAAESKEVVVVLVNTDVENSRSLTIEPGAVKGLTTGASVQPAAWVELLGQTLPQVESKDGAKPELRFNLAAGAAHCLARTPAPGRQFGEEYRRARALAAWGLSALKQAMAVEKIGDFDWRWLASEVERSPATFLTGISQFARDPGPGKLEETLRQILASAPFPAVTTWTVLDLRRVTVIPPGQWLLIQDTTPFRATLKLQDGSAWQHVESITVKDYHIACFAGRQTGTDAQLLLERYSATEQQVSASIRFLAPQPQFPNSFAGLWQLGDLKSKKLASSSSRMAQGAPVLRATDLVLLTNGRGGMARLCVDLGHINSKYDCVLGANLHPTLPVDRHILAKRIRVWVNADGFISPLDFQSLESLEPGPPAVWNFVANAGDGRIVEIQMTAEMVEDCNTTVFRFNRPSAAEAAGKQLPEQADVRLSVRIDLEDRGFHSETRRNGGADYHFNTHVHPLDLSSGTKDTPDDADVSVKTVSPVAGFAFTPAGDRQLRVYTDQGEYHPAPEWSESIPHPVEQTRGQVGSGDAFSPGWFDLPLTKGANVTLVVSAELPTRNSMQRTGTPAAAGESRSIFKAEDSFGQQLLKAARAYVVRRESGRTVIAGYPWFLDWGRDTFICARGLLAAGMHEEVRQIVSVFARFEKAGTLPNTIFGEDASNRDTSDAPLWFGLVCEELAGIESSLGASNSTGSKPAGVVGVYADRVDGAGRSLAEVLQSIARGYIRGTPNGIRMDPESGLIWSPSHFTWMDTNYPAGTPREGYPIELQALWIRLLRQLGRIGAPAEGRSWADMANLAETSLERFWLPEKGWYADVLHAGRGQSAATGMVGDALRSNYLLVVSLGLAKGARAKQCVDAAIRYLVVPGALRSLAPLPVSVPLPVFGNDGRLLNDPSAPYWGHYEGDEDTRRKPAYHNGTAWTWPFPIFCEALATAWDFSPESVTAAKAYLGSMEALLMEGCIGQIPEILDGDAPHHQRGCDAQAWGVTEALRIWKLLQERSPQARSRGAADSSVKKT
jgi:glycogen debranching enzyme